MYKGKIREGKEKILVKVLLFSKSGCCWATVAQLRTKKRCFGEGREGDQVGEEGRGGERIGKVAGVGHHPQPENATQFRIETTKRNPRSQDVGKNLLNPGSASCLQKGSQLV